MPSALFDVVVVFWLLLFYFFPSSCKPCFKVHKIWNYHKFSLIMINCYSWLNKPDSSYVVSWLRSVLFPLNYISIIIIIIQITINIIILLLLSLLLLLLSSLLLSPLLFLFFLCTGWSQTVVLAKGASNDPWKWTLRFRLLTLQLTNTFRKILSLPRRVVFWGQWNTNSCVQLSSHFSKLFVTLANDPTTICITCTVLVFHILVISL